MLTGTTLFFALLALVALVSMIFFIRHTTTRPLSQLQDVARHMSAGDYSQRVVVRTVDEVGQLGRAMNEMAETIEERSTRLSELNQNLAAIVDERTKELRAAVQEAREASRLKDEFLAVMSHELRTPLNAIIGFQGIMMMSHKLDDRSRRMVERTRANAERLLNLINDILDISRIEAGRMEITPEDVRIQALIEKISGPMSVLAEEKNLDFVIRVSPDVPEKILVDEDAITKVITNLLSNAFKFTEKGQVTLDLARQNGHWQIEVSDTGIGIPAHMQEVIFEQFRQVDGSTKRKYGGSGLGLAIVQRLCAAMNGTIQVRSAPGEGSTFTVTLPLEVEKEYP
jgi:signal transduction histidine kinase